jgi:hypothetical protein
MTARDGAATVVRLDAGQGKLREGERRLIEPLRDHPRFGEVALSAVAPRFADEAVGSIDVLYKRLAALNSDRTWWYLPVAEWQPFMSSLPVALEFRARLQTLAESSQGRFVLTVPDAVTAGYLLRSFERDSAVRIEAGWSSRLVWSIDRAKNPLRRLWNATAWLFEHYRARFAIDRGARRKRSPGRVDTLFVSRLERSVLTYPDGSWHDQYLGSLPNDGHQRGASIALFLRCGGDPRAQSQNVSRFGQFAVTVMYDWLTAFDVIAAMWRALTFRLIAGSESSALLQSAAAESRIHVRALADWILLERAISNALRAMVPRQIVCMQENSNWEHAIVVAAQAAAPKVRTIGFFHCPVLPSAYRYRTSETVRQQRPLFERTIPLGPAMRSAFLSLGDWGPLVDRDGYAFRNPELEACFALPLRPLGQPLTILVPLGGTFDNVRFLGWLDLATTPLDDIRFIVRAHPAYDPSSVLSALKVDAAEGRFFSSGGTLDEALGQADLMIYKGSTVCFAALAAGLPAIHIDDGGLASDNALFAAGDVSISVSTQQGLRDELQKIRRMSLDERRMWSAKARTYVRAYYELSNGAREAIVDKLFPAAAACRNRKTRGDRS